VYAYINRHRDIVVYFLVEKEETKQKGDCGYRTKPKTRSARITGKKTGREESIHTRYKLIETGKQTRKVREGD